MLSAITIATATAEDYQGRYYWRILTLASLHVWCISLIRYLMAIVSLYPSAVILADDSISFVGTYLARIIIELPPPTYVLYRTFHLRPRAESKLYKKNRRLRE